MPAAVQTVFLNALHAKPECESDAPPPVRPAAAGPARGLRGRGAPPQLHPRRRRAGADAVGRQPPGGGAGGLLRRGLVPASAPRAAPQRSRPAAAAHRGRCAAATAPDQHHAARRGAAEDGGGQHHRGLCRPVADPAAGRLHRVTARRGRAHLGHVLGGEPRARRRRRGHPLPHAGRRRGRRRAPVRRGGAAGVQRRSCAATPRGR